MEFKSTDCAYNLYEIQKIWITDYSDTLVDNLTTSFDEIKKDTIIDSNLMESVPNILNVNYQNQNGIILSFQLDQYDQVFIHRILKTKTFQIIFEDIHQNYYYLPYAFTAVINYNISELLNISFQSKDRRIYEVNNQLLNLSTGCSFYYPLTINQLYNTSIQDIFNCIINQFP
jgi:hypothetical protein